MTQNTGPSSSFFPHIQKSSQDSSSVIIHKIPAISANTLAQFHHAIAAQMPQMMPLTIATLFRTPEFEWLNQLHIDMRHLLHTEQEYRYLAEFEPHSHDITVYSRILHDKTRPPLRIMTIHSDIEQLDKIRIQSLATFVIKLPKLTPVP